jgi:hypothetical protein
VLLSLLLEMPSPSSSSLLTLSAINNDTLTTGDIYDYVVEGLSAGAATVVIVELTTAIPANFWCLLG